MSVRIMTAAWAVDLPAGDKLVLLALADCANDEGLCWPGLSTLCEKTGRCRRSLQESLRALDAAGHITRVENPGKGMNYTIHPVAKIATGAKSAPVAKSARGGGKNCHGGVAKSAPKPSKNHQEPSNALARKTTIPKDWKPLPFGLATESRKIVDGWPPGELARQVEAFTAYHDNKQDRWSDWQKTWATWVLNSRAFSRPNNGRHPVAPRPIYEVINERSELDRIAAGGSA